MSLSEKTRIIASPITASPSRTLVQELDVVLKRRLNLALFLILDPSLPLIRDQPPRHKVIIIRIKLEFPPAFSLEAFKEQRTLKNL
jgi:hypothetical protein